MRILKTEFGFQNTNTDFKNQMWVLILTINLYKNKFHDDEMIKIKFGFQNTNTGFKTQIRVLIQNPNTGFDTKYIFGFKNTNTVFKTQMCV